MRRTARHRIAAALLVTAGAALLTGCTAAAPDTSGTRTVTATASAAPTPSPSTTAPAPATPSTAPSASPSTSASAGAARVDPDAPAGQCADGALRVSVQHDPEGDGLGQRGAFVVLRNAGSSSCHLEGTPGLSLVGGGDGAQIGAPAVRSTAHEALVTLAPGASALAQVTYTYVDQHGGNFSDGAGHDAPCQAEAADGYRVYPPHSYRAFFSADRTWACSTDVHWIDVGPVRAASAFGCFTPKS